MIPSPRLVTTDTLACGPPIWITASCKVSTLRWDIAGGDGGGGREIFLLCFFLDDNLQGCRCIFVTVLRGSHSVLAAGRDATRKRTLRGKGGAWSNFRRSSLPKGVWSKVGGRAWEGWRPVVEELLNWALGTRNVESHLRARMGILKAPSIPGTETQCFPRDPQILVTTLPEASLSRQR